MPARGARHSIVVRSGVVGIRSVLAASKFGMTTDAEVFVVLRDVAGAPEFVTAEVAVPRAEYGWR